MRLLQGDFHDGDRIIVDVSDGQLAFERQEAQVATATGIG
jgi:predicted ferric reductase